MLGVGVSFSPSFSSVAATISSLVRYRSSCSHGVSQSMNGACQHACTTSRSGNASQSGRARNQSMISACSAGLSSTSARKAACCPGSCVPRGVEARSQEFPWDPGIGRVPGDGVQFMVAHDRERDTGVNHAACNIHRADLCRAAVNEIADEDRLALVVTPGAARVAIAELAEQCFQLVRLPVDVPDDVVDRDPQPCDALLRCGLDPWS